MAKEVEDLKALIAYALKQQSATQTRITQTAGTVAVGDLFAFRLTATDGIEWAIVLQHRDDQSLWFTIPFDQDPLVGMWDVGTNEYSAAGAGTLRCGRGIWLRTQDFARGKKSGFLESTDVRRAQEKLSAMTGDDSLPIADRPEIDEDPDYQEWMDELSRAAERLEQELTREEEVISIAQFATDWTSFPEIRHHFTRALAAQSSGLGAGPDTVPLPLPGKIIETSNSKTIVLVREHGGVRLQFYSEQEAPPSVMITNENTNNVIEWRPLRGHSFESVGLLDPASSPEISLGEQRTIRLTP